MTSSNTQAAAYGKRQKEEGSDLLFALKNKQANRSCQMAASAVWERASKRTENNKEKKRNQTKVTGALARMKSRRRSPSAAQLVNK